MAGAYGLPAKALEFFHSYDSKYRLPGD